MILEQQLKRLRIKMKRRVIKVSNIKMMKKRNQSN